MILKPTARIILASSTAIGLALAGTVLVSAPAAAFSLTVTNETELATAIDWANADSLPDTITIGSSFSLTADLPTITESLEINGLGTTIDGGGWLAFTVDGASSPIETTFSHITVNNAAHGIDAVSSDVEITNSRFNSAPVWIEGAGIAVTVTDSLFERATSPAGLVLDITTGSAATLSAVTSSANLGSGLLLASDSSATTIADSVFEHNGKGGIEADVSASTLTISSTSASFNEENGFNIDAYSGSTVDVTAITAEDNDDEGVEISAESGSTAEVADSTASDNHNDGFDLDVYDTGSAITITNSIATGQGSSGFRFDIDSGTLTASDLTANDNDDSGLDSYAEDSGSLIVSGMTATANGYAGAAVRTEDSGSVTVRDSTFADTYDGHGVEVETYYTGFVTLERLSVIRNQDGGIDIDDDAEGEDSVITITDSTIADNLGSGLEIDVTDSTAVSVQETTISGNSSDEGSGIRAELNDESSLAIANSTISANNHITGGALFVEGDGTPTSLTIAHSTITDNHASDAAETGGVEIDDTSYSIAHSIIAGNTTAGVASDLRFGAGTPPTGSVEYSLIQNSAGAAQTAVDGGTGNVTNTGAMLGALADNGGSTRTHLPLAGSPVINAGNPAVAGAPATDQRGETRIVDTIDFGAVEFQQAVSASGESPDLLAATGSTAMGSTFTAALLLTLGGLLLLGRRARASH